MLHANRSAIEIDGIPAILLSPPATPDDAPLVIALHGYTGSKERIADYCQAFRRLGYRVLIPDAHLHGARRVPDFEQRFAESFPKAFGAVVEQTADDVGRLIDRFAPSGPVALIGVSMGAWITYLVASRDPRVTVACPLIGSPYLYWQHAATGAEHDRIAEMNVATHPERLAPRCALLIQHGEEDPLVPIEQDRKLYERLVPLYASAPERLRFLPYPGIGHDVTPAMIAEIATWLRRFI